jgi:hypothetical protein
MPGIVNRYFILLPRIFHGAFHMDAGYFQWIFHSWPQDISLHISYGCLEFSIDISFCSPGYFIGIFIWMPGIFQLIFHSIPQDISLEFSYGCLAFSIDISFYSPGYFIAHFIWMPGIFNGYFILGPRIFHCAKNSHKIII